MTTSFRLGLAGLLAATMFSPAVAQSYFSGPTGYQAGDVLVHASVIGVIPEDFNSHVRVGQGVVSGEHVSVSAGISPEVDGSYFFTPSLSLEVIAATTRHNVKITGPANLKIGSSWVLPPTVTLQYHLPIIDGIRPYAGLGLTVAFFYDPHAAAGWSKVGGFSTGIGPSLDAGFDVPITGNWFANVDVKQIFIVTGTHVNHGFAGAVTELDPTVVGAGVGYLF
jgi:outer membrane protein